MEVPIDFLLGLPLPPPSLSYGDTSDLVLISAKAEGGGPTPLPGGLPGAPIGMNPLLLPPRFLSGPAGGGEPVSTQGPGGSHASSIPINEVNPDGCDS